MSIGKYVMNLVVAFITFAVLQTLAGLFLFGDSLKSLEPFVYGPETSQTMWVLVGHLLQTMAMVWLWMKGFATSDKAQGAFFGFVFGVVVAATDLVWWNTVKIPTDAVVMTVATGVVVAALVGVVLAALHKDETA